MRTNGRYGITQASAVQQLSGDSPRIPSAKQAPGSPVLRLDLRVPFEAPVLALGGDLKSSLCVGQDRAASILGPFGDLSDPARFRQFVRAVQVQGRSFNAADLPVVAHDLHPGYHSTQYARRHLARCVAVQHHHAHGVSAALDAEVSLPVIAIVCDGTGFGTDGAIWGGEVLLCRAASFDRLAHFRYFPLAGGDLGARRPIVPALGILHEIDPDHVWPSQPVLPSDSNFRSYIRTVRRQLAVGLNTIATSSLGRLFDAAAAILAVCDDNTHEGMAAIALETAAGDAMEDAYAAELIPDPDGGTVMDWEPLFRGLLADFRRGAPVHALAARFHATIANLLAEAARVNGESRGVSSVVLSGGCFLNHRLKRDLTARLLEHGMTVATHSRVPTGDAGLSLGQAFVGAAKAQLRGGTER